MAAQALGPAEAAPLRDLGYALGVANWLRAVPALEAQGRIPLVDGRPEGVVALAETGLARLARARGQRRAVSRAAAPACLTAWSAGPVLRQARSEPSAVAQGRLDPPEARGRMALIYRAATLRW